MSWAQPPHNTGHFLFFVRSRGRTTWVTQTIRGPRRVQRWEKWKNEATCGSIEKAREELVARKKRDSLRQYRIFQNGKAVD